MRTLGFLRQFVIDWIEDSSDTTIIDRAINRAVDMIQKQYPFEEMNETIIVTPDADGLFYAPPRCMDIIDISQYDSDVPVGTAFRFNGMSRIMAYPRQLGYSFSPVGITKNYGSLVNCDLVTGSNTVTQNDASDDDLTSDLVGTEMVINGGNERYTVLSFDGTGLKNKITIYPSYRFASVTADCVFTPEATKIFKVYDSSGNPYTSQIRVDYRAYHPVLVASTDPLLIPAPQSVGLEAVKFFLNQTKYTVDAQRLELALSQAKLAECSKQSVKMDNSTRPSDTIFAVRSASRRGRRER